MTEGQVLSQLAHVGVVGLCVCHLADIPVIQGKKSSQIMFSVGCFGDKSFLVPAHSSLDDNRMYMCGDPWPGRDVQ
jgi:hypothetical protein